MLYGSACAMRFMLTPYDYAFASALQLVHYIYDVTLSSVISLSDNLTQLSSFLELESKIYIKLTIKPTAIAFAYSTGLYRNRIV